MQRWVLISLLTLCPFLSGAGLVGTAVSNSPAAGANASQIWSMSWDQAILTTPGTTYQLPFASEAGDIQLDTTEANRRAPMPAAGVVSDLNCKLSGDLGAASDVLTFTIRKNAADTAVVCTITAAGGTEDSCNSGANTATFAAGDLISMSIVTADSPLGVFPSCYALWTPTVANEFVLLAANTAAATSSLRHFVPHGVSSATTTENVRQMVMPLSGSITAIYVKTDATYAGTSERTFVLSVANTNTAGTPDTDVQCALNSTNTTACNDTTEATEFTAGQIIGLRDTGTPGGDAEPTDNRGFGFRLVPSTAGEFPLVGMSVASASTTLNRFQMASAGTGTVNATETSADSYMPAFTAKRIHANVVTASSVGYAFSLRDDGAASSAALSCDNTTTTACSATATANIGAGSMVGFLIDPGAGEANSTGAHSVGVGATYP